MPQLFYSWQSEDLTRKKAIRKILNRSVSGTEWEVVESSTNIHGAVDIAKKIDEDVRNCDYFVADMCVVAKSLGKCFINSNVAFEVGIALATKGEENVLLLVSPGDTDRARYPFDTRNRAMMQYEQGDPSLENSVISVIQSKTRAISTSRSMAYQGPDFKCADIIISNEENRSHVQFSFVNKERIDYRVELIIFGSLFSQSEFVVNAGSEKQSSAMLIPHYPFLNRDVEFKYSIESLDGKNQFVIKNKVKLTQQKDGLFYFSAIDRNVEVKFFERNR